MRTLYPALLGMAALCTLNLPSQAADPAALATAAGCPTCHLPDAKKLGPSYQEIAAKYQGKPDAVALLSASVRNGSKGTWGQIPMMPTDAKRLSDADLETVITWVLQTP